MNISKINCGPAFKSVNLYKSANNSQDIDKKSTGTICKLKDSDKFIYIDERDGESRPLSSSDLAAMAIGLFSNVKVYL